MANDKPPLIANIARNAGITSFFWRFEKLYAWRPYGLVGGANARLEN